MKPLPPAVEVIMKIDKDKLHEAREIAKQAVTRHCKTRWWLAMNHLKRAYGFTQ
ncbi:hypothetical protein ABRZ24_13915 [Brenneria populi]|uniref:Uncharacterized protein n=1 Tax=Brenneria populi TaxID=1505588 RepID=A0ABU6JT60_9GAMM|nr:hypothetical protein [Brenneria populi Li et al. 2015]